MELADNIYKYYLDNSSSLGEDKLFHFASRMAAWRGDKKAFDILKNSYEYIVQPDKNINDIIRELVDKPQTGRRNAHELRQPFFEKYPQLYGVHLALFRVRHLESIYKIDAREALYSAISENSLKQLEKLLLNDDEGLRVLSTFAINYCYLLERVVMKNNDSLPIEHFYNVGLEYNTSKNEGLQLLIYLYTHCIIGESNFYTKKINDDKLPIYIKMLSHLEKIIDSNFDRINLDNKLEFLVCARICNYKTSLKSRIFDECERSISPDGMFIIDIHNHNIQEDRNDFVRSEHRNVLFIMASSEYKPHSTLIR